eukprot:3745882-Amphidinium_carterae.1
MSGDKRRLCGNPCRSTGIRPASQQHLLPDQMQKMVSRMMQRFCQDGPASLPSLFSIPWQHWYVSLTPGHDFPVGTWPGLGLGFRARKQHVLAQLLWH